MMIDVTVAPDFIGDLAQVCAQMNPLAAGAVMIARSDTRAVFETAAEGRYVITGQNLEWSADGQTLLGGAVDALTWRKGAQDVVTFATLQTTGDVLWAAFVADGDDLTRLLMRHCWTYHGSDLAEVFARRDAGGVDAPNLPGKDRIYLYGGDDQFFTGSANDSLYGGDGDDWLAGGGNEDLLDGGTGDDVLRGGSGHDTLVGGTGFDSLTGGAGDDRLMGGFGADWIAGGAGADELTGGAQGDVFVFGPDADTDVITDFEIGQDHLQILTTREIEVVAQGDDTLIVYGWARIVLIGVDADQITPAEFV